MNAIALLAALLVGQVEPLPLVEQSVDMIAVCHVAGENGDYSLSCYRVIYAAAWVESREQVSPLAVECDKPWHARLLEPGLKKARGPF